MELGGSISRAEASSRSAPSSHEVYPLRVVILTWEYPPRIVGEMARYAQSLCQELAKRDFETHVVTYNEDMKGVEKEASGIIVHRVGNPVPTHLNVLTWALTLSTEFERVCADIHYDAGPVDLMDCHEWLSVPAATSLSNAFRIPYVMTVNSLEEQRSSYPDNPMSLAPTNVRTMPLCSLIFPVRRADAPVSTNVAAITGPMAMGPTWKRSANQ